jgi:NIMA (never in mitosis gene a)-related kinase
MVGKGSFASVYKVMRKDDGKIYAMKRIKINKMSRKEIADSLNEVRFLSSVRHYNIVGFYEAFLENNETELCIIMDYCSCGDLAQKIERYKKRRQYIQEIRIWGYLIQSLRALQVLHQHNICHRDLKAANTFLAEDGSIKIGDMNVSKRMKQGRLHTQIGTPYYMSPEIWNNCPYDERCDIWSLGCMIYELTALRPPFLGDSFAALKRSVVVGRYPSIPPVFSESLSTVIALMLRVSPTQRPTAAQLLSHTEIMKKIAHLHLASQEPIDRSSNVIMNTIKVPMALKRLNEALPKACYPTAHDHAVASVAENDPPVTARSNVSAAPNKRRPLAPITNLRNPPENSDNNNVPSKPDPRKLCDPKMPRPPLAPLSEKENTFRAEPTNPAPKVRFNRRLW